MSRQISALPRSQVHALWRLLVLRCLFFAVLVYGLNAMLALGTHVAILTSSACLGCLAGTRTAFSALRPRGFWIVIACLIICVTLGLEVFARIPSFFGFTGFAAYSQAVHGYAILAFFLLGATSSWGFWRYRHALTAEALLLFALAVALFAGHRNFHFDSPQIINSLAWWLRVDQITMLVGIGVSLFVVVSIYLSLASSPSMPRANSSALETSIGRPHIPAFIILSLLLVSILAAIAQGIHAKYAQIAKTRIANGVGEAEGEGMSPLSFHSALGSTNQPSALVRLEGDYKENPFSPMLYLRESALSEFNGREMAIASPLFDADVPRTGPNQPFKGEEDPRLEKRHPLVQSMYLLTEHKLGFAIDYPVSVVPLKNPNPSRFKNAFRVHSFAPAFQLSELATQETGDPRWSEQVRSHYLKQHPDPRYALKAKEISAGLQHPLEQAVAIIQHLNKTAIYTLTPNHEVAPDADPVAPFLFGDNRGYCVHFAHAITFMLRGLGIPARIATGYMTDLSQARDGHILLRMSDRHAWAEAYVQDFGWIPIDIQPEQVESHADTQVDMKVLEELMDLLGPDEELLPNNLLADEASQQPANWNPISLSWLWYVIAALIASATLVKIALRHAWRLPANSHKQIKRAYISLASILYDMGLRRRRGETRLEFHARLQNTLGTPLPKLLALLDPVRFGNNLAAELSFKQIAVAHQEALSELSQQTLWRRVTTTLSPASMLHYLSGGKW